MRLTLSSRLATARLRSPGLPELNISVVSRGPRGHQAMMPTPMTARTAATGITRCKFTKGSRLLVGILHKYSTTAPVVRNTHKSGNPGNPGQSPTIIGVSAVGDDLAPSPSERRDKPGQADLLGVAASTRSFEQSTIMSSFGNRLRVVVCQSFRPLARRWTK